MSRDFEFRQILRAYRNGIIDEATFDKEMARLESDSHGVSTNGGSFRAMGKSYPSERAAIMNFLENTAAGEAGGAEAFTKWAAVCKTDCIRSGLRMVAEREAYHARQLAQRLHDMGGECKASMSEEGRKFVDFVSNPERSDVDKLSASQQELRRPRSDFQAGARVHRLDQGRPGDARDVASVHRRRVLHAGVAGRFLQGAKCAGAD